jgi:septal ring factor EnvC (AmiA/AmiB activator)
MIRRGKLEKRRGNRGEWLVLVPAEMMTGSDPVDDIRDPAPGDADKVDGSVMAKLTDALTELAALEHELGAALTRSAVAQGETASLRDALTKAETRIDRLEAALAEERRPWLARVLDAARRKA